MKNVFIVLVTISMLLLTGCKDGFVSSPSTEALMNPGYAYELDTWGSNSEIYEFTPKSNQAKTCVVFILDSGGAMGLQCFDKVNIN